MRPSPVVDVYCDQVSMRPGYDPVRIEMSGIPVSSNQLGHVREAKNPPGAVVVADEIQKGHSALPLES